MIIANAGLTLMKAASPKSLVILATAMATVSTKSAVKDRKPLLTAHQCAGMMLKAWPVSVGHGCIGCTEPKFWDTMTPFYERLPNVKIPGIGGVNVDKAGKTILGIAAAAVGIHAAVGIGKKLSRSTKDDKKDI